ncbi:sulfite exporter TauE/SafE family protein [Chloroflexota bacterium]
MIVFPSLPGVEINLFFLVFIGISAGILSGFTGVGGAFIVTPALIILGFPANLAVGTSLTWVMGNSIIGVFRHRSLGNVDTKLGLTLLVAVMGGVEIGVRIVNWVRDIGLADEVVLLISICLLLIVGVYTVLECIKRKKHLDKILKKGEAPPPAMRSTSFSQKLQSINLPPMISYSRAGVTISLWIILAIGFLVGIIVGIIGVGGGFIMVPALVYLIGLPSFIAVGTDLFQIIFSAAYGSIRHTMSGNVLIFASLILIVASSIGVQVGALVTRYVRGVSARFVLGTTILLVAISSIFKLLSILMKEATVYLESGSVIIILSGMGLAVIMILLLLITANRYRRGQCIPSWVESLVAKSD